MANKESRKLTRKRWRQKHLEQSRESHKRDWLKHKEERIEGAIQYYHRVVKPKMIAWGRTLDKKDVKKISLEAEKIAVKVLGIEGFKEVFQVNGAFPFDLLAKKNENIHLVEVTTCYKKRLKDHQIKLAKYCQYPIVLIFIKPDFTEYKVVVNPKYRNTFVFSTFQNEPIKSLMLG